MKATLDNLTARVENLEDAVVKGRKYRCSCGSESEIVFDSFRRGNRCQDCGNKKISVKVSGAKHPNWNPNRQQVAENLKFRKLCCGMVKNVLKCVGRTKVQKTAVILGYDYKQLRQHIQSHPNWLLVQGKKWHIDHIFPVKAFLDYGIFDLKLINGLDNLRPLTQNENLTKHAKYDCKAFEAWLHYKGIKVPL